jgi:hypothetical protein
MSDEQDHIDHDDWTLPPAISRDVTSEFARVTEHFRAQIDGERPPAAPPPPPERGAHRTRR